MPASCFLFLELLRLLFIVVSEKDINNVSNFLKLPLLMTVTPPI